MKEEQKKRLKALKKRERQLKQEIADECYAPRKEQDGTPRGSKIGDPTYSGALRIGRLCDALRSVKNEIRRIENDEQ